MFFVISFTKTHAPITGTVNKATMTNCHRKPFPTVRKEESYLVRSGIKKLFNI